MYQWAEAAVCELEQSDYEQLYQEEMNRSGMTHGEYNYHNIIMTREGIATMNFEKFHRDIQVEDLYYFLRKVMEKSGWKLRLGDGMLNAYSAIHPLTRSETEYLKIRLIYPEKFWKYTWIPAAIIRSVYNSHLSVVRLLEIPNIIRTFLTPRAGRQSGCVLIN